MNVAGGDKEDAFEQADREANGGAQSSRASPDSIRYIKNRHFIVESTLNLFSFSLFQENFSNLGRSKSKNPNLQKGRVRRFDWFFFFNYF